MRASQPAGSPVRGSDGCSARAAGVAGAAADGGPGGAEPSACPTPRASSAVSREETGGELLAGVSETDSDGQPPAGAGTRSPVWPRWTSRATPSRSTVTAA